MKNKVVLMVTGGLLLASLILTGFVFAPLFINLPVWGDAPFFYLEGMKELVAEPSLWTSRGIAFGGINQFIFIWPIMFIFGLLGTVFDLSSIDLIRIVFYLPSIGAAFAGAAALAGYFGLSFPARVAAGIFYVFNTYFLLIVDGGQVGVGLAYSLAPLSVFFIRRWLDKPRSRYSWVLCFGVSWLNVMADPRIFLIVYLSVFFWLIVERRRLWGFLFLGLGLFFVNLYWILPLFNFNEQILPKPGGLRQIGIQNSVAFFQPHWPDNQLGVIHSASWYFYILPIVFLAGFFWLNKTAYVRLFIIWILSALLTGGLLTEVLISLPFGSAFRDATKFFTPTFLFGSILVSFVLDRLNKWYFYFLYLLMILVLIHPVFTRGLNFNLSYQRSLLLIDNVIELIHDTPGFLRAVWFPERYPLAYHTDEKQALDANTLVNKRVFAVDNVGTFDRFNFLYHSDFVDKFRLLGLKYLILSGDFRKLSLSEEEGQHWQRLFDFLSSLEGLSRVDYAGIPVFDVGEVMPRIFASDFIYVVIGPEIKSGFYPAVYLEDGVLNPHLLEGREPDSAVLVFNGKDKIDLTFSFLQDSFLSFSEAQKNQWAFYPHEDFLSAKYQLLIRGVDFSDFDYARGLGFSSVENEIVSWKFNVQQSGTYVVGLRMGLSEGGRAEVFLDENSEVVDSQREGLFWYTMQLNLEPGEHTLKVLNRSGVSMVNVVAVVDDKQWKKAVELANVFLAHFQTADLNQLQMPELKPVDFEFVRPFLIKVSTPEDSYWIVFTDSYHPLWQLRQGRVYHDSLPVFSGFNLFYTESDWADLQIVFRGQETLRWGFYWSLVSFIVVVLIFLLWDEIELLKRL